MNDEQRRALSEYDTARLAVAKVVPGDKGSESKYGIAYQRLVGLGLMPQLKKKYR